MKPKYNPFLHLLVTSSALLPSTIVHAANGTWATNSGTAIWSDTTKWSGSTVAGITATPGDLGNLTNNITGATTINIDTAVMLGTINIGDSNSSASFNVGLTTGNLTLQGIANGTGALINQVAGTAGDTISANFTLNDNLTVSNASTTKNLTISGIMTESSGPLNLSKTGNGTVLMTNSASSYTGNTTVSAGVLLTNFTGNTSGYTVAAGAGMAFGNSVSDTTIGNILTNSTATIAAGAFVGFDTTAADRAYSGNFTDNGANALGLVKVGANKLTLSGNNSYTGGTKINGGTISLGSANALGTTGTISFGGGTLQWSASNTTDYSSRFATTTGQTFSCDPNGQTITLASDITTSNGFAFAGATGTLIVSGNNTGLAGDALASGGTFGFGSNTALGSVRLRMSSGIGETVQAVGGARTISNVMSWNSNTAVLNISGTNDLTFNSQFTSTNGNLGYYVKTITVNNTGLTTLAGGIAVLQGASTVSPATTINGAGKITISGPIINGSTNATTAGITYSGSGLLTLSGTNSYTGATSVTSGTLVFAKRSALYTAGAWTPTLLSANSGAILGLGVGDFASGYFDATALDTFRDASHMGLSAVTTGFKTGAIFGIDTTNATAGTFTYSSSITDFGTSLTNGLAKLGAGTLILTGTNTYTGNTTIQAGTLALGDGTTTGSVAGNITNNGTLELNPAAAGLTYGGVISGTGTLFKTGANEVTLNGANTFSGTTTVSAGTLTLGNALALQNSMFDTTGAGTLKLSAITSLSMGGLTGGGTFNPTNFGSVTALTLRPQLGVTANYSGTLPSGSGMTLTKTGAGTQVLSGLSGTAASNYTGLTTIDQGTLKLSAANSNLTGGLTFGAIPSGGVNTGTLDLSSGSATFAGGLTVQTNSTTANTISIGTGQTLTTGGTVIIGANGGTATGYNPVAKLTVSGLGSWSHTGNNTTFRIGNNSNAGAGSQRSANSTLDLSGLAQFTADVRFTGNSTGGSFIVGDASGGGNGVGQTLILSGNNTISAGSLNVQSANGATGTNRLALGSGANVFNAGSLNVGGTQRGDNMLDFNGATGTFKLRGGDTTGTASVNLGAVNSSSTSTTASTINLAGHSADLSIGTLAILNSGTGLTSAVNHTATFTFDSGNMTAVDVRVGRKQNSASVLEVGIHTANLNIGNGTTNLTNTSTLSGPSTIGWNEDGQGTSVGNLNIAGGNTTVNFTNAGNNLVIAQSSNGGNATGTLAISDGATTITRGITLANKTAGNGTVNGTINLTGGNLTLGSAGITTTANTTSTLTLNGGSLNMNGNGIGDATNSITTLNFQTGTLSNVSEINNGAGLAKSTAGTLTLTGTNTYTGATDITVGTLALGGGSSHTSPMTVSSGATLGFTSGSTTTTSSTVTFSGATANVAVSGAPVAGTLLTTTALGGITGTPVLNPAIPAYVLAIEDGGTTLKLKAVASNNYNTWATTNGVPGQAANLDHDNDGVSNGVEYFIGGPTGNTTGFTPVPSVTTTLGVSSVTWTKAASYTGTYLTDFIVETSTTLDAGSWATEPSPGTVTISGINVTYTFPAGPLKKFARLKVTGP